MKNKLWLAPLPIIALFSLLQLTFDWGEQGKLNSKFLRERIYEISRNSNGIMTNIKFRMRGPRKPHPNIVIVTADDSSVEKLGRWPWHREVYGDLVRSIFALGGKYIALDITYSEPEERIPADIYQKIGKISPKLEEEIKQIEGDPYFANVILQNRQSIVLGYAPTPCQPLYDKEECPVDNTYNVQSVEEGIGKFAQSTKYNFSLDQLKTSPISNILGGVFNTPLFASAANHAGYFYVVPDPDGFVRRYPLVLMGNNKIYTSLASKMAELIKGDTLQVDLLPDTRIEKMYFKNSPNEPLPVTKLGYLDLNFKGPRETYPYISAVDVLLAAQGDDPETTKKVREALKNKYVFFGVSALGIYDMRAFPFDSNTPGVEGHATALDNLLSEDSLKSASGINLEWLPLALLIAVGLIFAILFSHLEAVPSLLVFAGFILGFGYLDVYYLFKQNINLPSAFLYMESFLIFALTLSIRYVLEEKNKKYIKSAFSHYLAPQVVDLVLKDPSKLAVGGERRELSILFSDLRGFTTISENMEPKVLSQFLNEYLTQMTDQVFENEGTLDKYIGDAVMAFWGAPVLQEDHVVRACLAGLNMQKKLREIAPEFKKKYGVDVGMGVGINSGVVSVGNMGSSRIFEYTVIGDHVNLASRLEGLTRLYGVDVLSTTQTMQMIPEQYKNKIYYRIIDSVKVKGKKVATELVELSLEPFNAEAIKLFATARQKFSERQWDEAQGLYEQASKIFKATQNREDPVAEVYIERCQQFKISPPAEGWDGSIEMRSK